MNIVKLRVAGDVNGDGQSDLIVSAKANPALTVYPKVFIYLGNSSSFPKINLDYEWAVTEPQARNPDSVGFRTFGNVVGSAGDINGDGYGDIFIADYRYDNIGGRSQSNVGYWGRAYIYFGGPPNINDQSGLGVNPTPQTADVSMWGDMLSGGFGESVG